MFLLRPLWGLIKKIYHHFDTLPPAVELENSRFYTVSNVAETGAWIAHFFWGIAFYMIGIYPVALMQIVSVAFYVTAILFNRRGMHMLSMTFALGELVLHQVLIVWLIGPNAGFQYFIPVVGIFPFLKPRGNVFLKWLLLLMCIAGFLVIELYLRKMTPVYTISAEALAAFNISNIVLSFVFVGIWAYYLTLSIYRSEVILRQRTTELAVAEQKAVQAEIEHALSVKERDNEIYRLKNVELKQSYDEILEKNRQIEDEKTRSRNLLLNILPEATAEELLNKGKASSRQYNSVTVLFSDFVGFTRVAERMSAEALIRQIDHYFHAFDLIMKKHGIEKIKTIGDAYMAAGGIPAENTSHPFDVAAAALEMLRFVEEEKKTHELAFDIRIGIHTGPLVAGVVGQHKFQYDIWGDTVNVAARMEQNSEAGKINISESTFRLIQPKFSCSSRGMLEAKNKGRIGMYFLESVSA